VIDVAAVAELRFVVAPEAADRAVLQLDAGVIVAGRDVDRRTDFGHGELLRLTHGNGRVRRRDGDALRRGVDRGRRPGREYTGDE